MGEEMKNVIGCLFVLLFCVSCLEVPLEGDEESIGHVDTLVYNITPQGIPTTTVIGRHGEIKVKGSVILSVFMSEWWAYVDEVAGTVRFINSRKRGKICPIYFIYVED